jgi:sulfite exporter TauE/SafE/copper chaperone CopZ
MHKIEIPIKGMHCRSCELLITDKIQDINGVKSVKVNYKQNNATIIAKTSVTELQITNAIKQAGYSVGFEEKSFFTHDQSIYNDLLISAVILVIIYFIARKLNLFSINFVFSNQSASLLVVLLVGLTAGVSSCMALVGGLVLGISARHSETHPEATTFEKFKPHIYFNLGRIISYAVLGGMIGLIGKAFQFSGFTLGLLTVFVGIIMLTLGLQLTEIFPKLSAGVFTLPSWLKKFLRIKANNKQKYSHINSMIVGALTFFLPCGFTQAMQFYAMSTGSFISGAFIMGIFAIGTTPGLLGVGGLTSIIRGQAAKKFFKFVGLVVISLAIFNLANGLSLLGFKPNLNLTKTIMTETFPPIENGFQIIKMTQTDNSYVPNIFIIKKGIPVRWIINSTNPYSCAGSIYSRELNLNQRLNAGENFFTFTPEKTGEINFSCLMGMYTGKFIVKE